MKPKFNFKLAGGLILLSILAIVIFRTAKELSLTAYVVAIAVYSIATLAAALRYIALNRGLVGARITYDLLPAEWSEEQKKAFMDDYAERREKSKKMLIILVPMIATFFFEAIDVYFLRDLLEKLQK